MTQQKAIDNILLEDRYAYAVFTSLSAKLNGGYKITIEFINLSCEEFRDVVRLAQLNKVLKLSSEVLVKQLNTIQHIIVSNFRTDKHHSMTWECLLH